jgi:hypothetical protein
MPQDEMPHSTPNPFAPAISVQEELGVFGDAKLHKKSFLHRTIRFGAAHDQALLVYSGWWFVQRIYLNGKLVWWAISWLTIRSVVEFELSNSATKSNAPALPSHVKIEIDFARGLQIRRFRVWLDHEISYDEIC